MYKKTILELTKKEKKDLLQAGIKEQAIQDHVLAAMNEGVLPYREFVDGKDMLRVLYIEKQKETVYMTVANITCVLDAKEETVSIKGISSKFKDMTIAQIYEAKKTGLR